MTTPSVVDRIARLVMPLESAEIVTRSMHRSGRRDLGPLDFAEPLEVLCRSLERDADLTVAGRRAARKRLTDGLAARARAVHELREQPEIHTVGLAAPIVLLGLPTSTAPLRELLGCDPRVHPADDARLLAESVASMDLECEWHVPAYAEWLDGADLTAAYAGLAERLRLEQWRAGDWPAHRRWVLDALQHAERIDELDAAMPGATYVEVDGGDDELASWTDEVVRRRRRWSSGVDASSVERYWRWRIERIRTRSASARAGRGARVLRLDVAQVVADPGAVVEAIGRAAGLEPGDPGAISRGWPPRSPS